MEPVENDPLIALACWIIAAADFLIFYVFTAAVEVLSHAGDVRRARRLAVCAFLLFLSGTSMFTIGVLYFLGRA